MDRIQELNKQSESDYDTAKSLLHRKEYDKAIDYFSRAISLNPQYSKAYFGRACCWQLKEEFIKSLNDYSKVIELQPDHIDTYINRGNLFKSNGDFDSAISDFTKGIELKSDLEFFYYYRGCSWHSKKEYKKAIDDFSKSVLHNPDNSEVYGQLGCSYYYSKDFDSAIEALSKAIKLNSNYARAYNIRGQVWIEIGNIDEAIIDCSKAISLDPNLQEAYVIRGNAMAIVHKYKNAIKDFTQAIKLRPGDVIAHFNRGKSWFLLEDYNKAIIDSSDAIIINSTYSSAYDLRGNAWISLGEFMLAINDLNHVIILEENNPIYYNSRGVAWKGLKNYGNAKNDFITAIELQSNFAPAHFNLYSIYIVSINKDLNITLALCNLNRANYLNYDKIEDLIDAYQNTFLLPFMLRRVLLKFQLNPLESLLNSYIKNQAYCENWEIFIDLINYNYFGKDSQINNLRLKAIVNYFMGDCIEAFKIYDEEIDTLESEVLSLRDQYYYIKSAQEFLEPYGDILKFALNQVEAIGKESVENKYYGGLIYLLVHDKENAEYFFLEAAKSGFLPALYQLAGLYNKNLTNFEKRDSIIRSIESEEENNLEGHNLLNGIKTLIIDEKSNLLPKLFNYCNYYAYYAENIEEIQLVRELLCIDESYNKTEFWELAQLNEDDRKFYKDKVEYYELLELEQKMFKAFDEFCKKEKEEVFIQRISDNNQALITYKELKSFVEDEDLKKANLSYEKVLALKIKDMGREKIPVKWFLVFTKLLYLKGHLSNKEALTLHLYAQKLALQNKDQSILEGVNLEIEAWFGILTGIPSPFIAKMALKGFKFIQDGFTIPAVNENQFEDYIEFKENYYIHLDLWRTSLLKELNVSN